MNRNKENMELSYEVKKLKAKLNLSSDIAREIDEELLMLKICERDDFDTILDRISKKINEVRDGLRDLADFMREKE